MSERLSICRQVKGGIHPVWVALLDAIRIVRAPQAAPSARVARGVFVEIAKTASWGGGRQAEGGGRGCPGSHAKENACQLLQKKVRARKRSYGKNYPSPRLKIIKGTEILCTATAHKREHFVPSVKFLRLHSSQCDG